MTTRRNAWMVIAAGAVLAAAIVTRTPAQQEYGGRDGACCYPNGSCSQRFESECDAEGGTWHGAGVACQQIACFPNLPPTVVGVSVMEDLSGTLFQYRVFRVWSDGQIDQTWVQFANNCEFDGPICNGVLLAGTCPTDVDRDGDTGINDFLTLLGGWGACR